VKKRIDLVSVMFNLVSVLCMGVIVVPMFGKMVAFGMMAVLFVIPFLGYWAKSAKRDVVLYAGLLKEIWLDEIKQNFYADAPHILRSQDMSSLVYNSVINLADAGINPNVLINNTVFPVPTVSFGATPLVLPLKVFDTENTSVKDTINKQYMFDAVKQAVSQHKAALQERIFENVTHSWAPQSNATLTPVLAATGAIKVLTGRRRLTMSDIATLQRAYDIAKIPQSGRILVLCPDHRQDLIDEDRTLFKQFSELKTGEVFPLYGFTVYQYALNPLYTTAGAKKAFGAALVPATDCYASISWCENEVMRAAGKLEMFWRSKEQNPEQREDVIGFKQFYTGLPIRNKTMGAIYSGV
jgi:hypothetical protein